MQTFAPGGVTGRLSLRSRREVAGELLAVEDSAFLLLAVDRTLVRVPLSVVRSAQAAYGGFVSPLTPWERERIRLASRYPDGVTPELEQHLLAAYLQQAVTMISK